METLQNALQRMGSNFIVASFVPAMGFVISLVISFVPIMPPSFLTFWNQISENFYQAAVVALVFTILLGFTLFTLSTYIYKSFEGYTFILGPSTTIGKAGVRRQKKRAKQISVKIQKANHAIKKLDDNIESLNNKPFKRWSSSDLIRFRNYNRKKINLEEYKYRLVAYYNQSFPPINLILPTRFGNVLRAAETYPANRYGIDAVELWPRLAHVIPSKGMELVDTANNECLFLLNSAVLATLLSGLSVLAALYQFILSLFLLESYPWFEFLTAKLPPYHYQLRAIIYVVLAIISLAVAYFFYEASVLNVGQFGDSIRSSYDLYRFDLLRALHLKPPKTFKEEIELWDRIGNFVTLYPDKNAPIDFTYSHINKDMIP
jgi:hypothetical protein